MFEDVNRADGVLASCLFVKICSPLSQHCVKEVGGVHHLNNLHLHPLPLPLGKIPEVDISTGVIFLVN